MRGQVSETTSIAATSQPIRAIDVALDHFRSGGGRKLLHLEPPTQQKVPAVCRD
jgi:hypothetical protein